MRPLAGVEAIGNSGANPGPGMDPRLKPAAHEFEACLMKEFLKPLEKDALFDDGKDSADTSDNALMGFGSAALARAISERGGFGIATRIIKQLEGKSSVGQTAGEAENSLTVGGKK